MRLAEEYDAAQDRGEVKRNGGDRSTVDDRNTASAADLGIRRDEIHEARKSRTRAVHSRPRPGPGETLQRVANIPALDLDRHHLVELDHQGAGATPEPRRALG